MSAKLNLFLILILSIFATAGAGVYMTQRQPSALIVGMKEAKQQQLTVVQQSQAFLDYPERSDYKTIPLESINSALQGSDPATLALNAFEGVASVVGTRKVEVVYPQRNQASVTITQIKPADDKSKSVGAIKYRVEMTTFGRSLLVSSRPMWQIIWAGSQVQCWTGSSSHKKLTEKCQ
ncbi:hypothetical protein Cylst_4773 [Cylindrospermum stagnale PCC 7417]|uniref:Uncharacterized protein n=1 Tax=Cylindrospermum stagnale PCC 7417 TaxID=56107 RepID=K9X409_9NOST|nr:hypothetical protein [Cylindrospermum stagnale]AFZ26834.1 hypothetical protein Cylst_4773 [Cylindrospermum stagnale PCC 7417]